MSPDAVGFWSYARDDDEAEEGRILRLSQQLRAEYELITGESLTLFVDRESIEWGEQWRARIDQALAGTTFFIPIVTPRFLMRAECRRELLTFAATAKSLDLEELILPIHYVPVLSLEPGQTNEDEVVSLVAERQWEDWRTLRLQDQTSSGHRQGVNKLAARLAKVAARVHERPDILPGVRIAAGKAIEEQGGEETEGVIDLLAKGEQAFPKLAPILEAENKAVASVGELMKQATQRVELSDSLGKGFAGRLTVSRQLARDLEPLAEEVASLGGEYASVLVDIDPAILTILRTVEANPEQYEEQGDVRELIQSIKEMIGAARRAAEHTEGLVANLDATASLSRDLKKPARRMQIGLRGFLDGRAMFDEWDRLIEKIETKRSQNGDAV